MSKKKELGMALRKSTTKKPPLDIKTIEKITADKSSGKTSPGETDQPEKEPTHRTTIDLPISLYEALRVHAFRQKTSMKDYIAQLIIKDLDL